jgi:hypothetical protein
LYDHGSPGGVTDEATVKARLRALATTSERSEDGPTGALDTDHQQTIEEATARLEDVEAAAAFVDDGGLAALEDAVAVAERSVSTVAGEGRETLAEYRRLAAAVSGDQFHSGRGTSLGDDTEAGTR